MATATALCRGALVDLGILAAGETMSAEDASDVLAALNMMADALGLERLTLYKSVRTTKTLTASTASYTIGSGASIDVARPSWIDRAGLVLDTAASIPTEIPITVLDELGWASVVSKTLTSVQPDRIFYDHGLSASGYGTIYVFPIPTVSTTQLVIYGPGGELSTFADLDTDYVLPRGYGRALRKNLAIEIAPMFDAQPSRELITQANESKAVIKRANYRPIPLRCDAALIGAGGAWNIETGGYDA